MTPSVAIDARMLRFSGIGTYLRGLLDAFRRTVPESSAWTLFLRESDTPPRWDGPRRVLHAPIYSLREQWDVPRAFRKSGASLLHVPHYSLPVLSVRRSVVTVHDLIHLKFPQFLPSRLALAYASIFFHRVVPRAQAILTVSEHTKRDLVEMLGIPPSRITVTPPGVPEGFRPLPPAIVDAALGTLGLKRGYLLYVGNLKAFKNTPFLLEAYDTLRNRWPDVPELVVIGRNFIPGFDERLRRTSGIRWIPDIDRTLLPAVYNGAAAFVFPSLYEGFGLPPLEAMACGVPVLCSNRASLPEVVGDAARLIDPLDRDGLVNALQQVLSDTGLRQTLTQKGLARAAAFSWETTARKTLEVYERCLA